MRTSSCVPPSSDLRITRIESRVSTPRATRQRLAVLEALSLVLVLLLGVGLELAASLTLPPTPLRDLELEAFPTLLPTRPRDLLCLLLELTSIALSLARTWASTLGESRRDAERLRRRRSPTRTPTRSLRSRYDQLFYKAHRLVFTVLTYYPLTNIFQVSCTKYLLDSTPCILSMTTFASELPGRLFLIYFLIFYAATILFA